MILHSQDFGWLGPVEGLGQQIVAISRIGKDPENFSRGILNDPRTVPKHVTGGERFLRGSQDGLTGVWSGLNAHDEKVVAEGGTSASNDGRNQSQSLESWNGCFQIEKWLCHGNE
eukprot:scaffold25382_cov137-Cylindrotheca_fusiformis.AAC.3